MDSLEYIDDFFKGNFASEEAKLFEERIQQDPVFAQEVAFYILASATVKGDHAEERKTSFRQIYQESGIPVESKKRKVVRFWPAWIAAAAVLAIIACWYLIFSPVNPSKLADQYIKQSLTQLSVKMGSIDSMQIGLNLFNQGKYPAAQQQFESILRSDSSNATAILNAGIVSLKMNNYDKALLYFRKLEIRTDLQVNPALFFEALSLMMRNQTGDITQAKQILQEIVQKDLDKREDARLLLRKM
jgi:tetratricopeptide (TPR) repeat protein